MEQDSPQVTVYLGLGTNLGDRRQQLREAVEKLKGLPNFCLLRQSAVYETEPWGYAAQPQFLNMVIEGTWSGSAEELLEACQGVERDMGRQRRKEGDEVVEHRWGPRVMDVDILLFGNRAFELPELVIPHPRMHERAFVMVPLSELRPDLEVRGQTTSEWAGQLSQSQGVVRLGQLGES